MWASFIRRTRALAHKELLHMTRDPQFLYLALGMPLVLVLLFGYAVNFDVDESKLAVLDLDRTPASRALIARLDVSRSFDVSEELARESEVEGVLRRGDAKAVLVIPKGLMRAQRGGEPSTLQLAIDGADGSSAQVILGDAQAFAQSETARLHERVVPVVEPRVRTLFNPDMKSPLFIVPGLVAVILAILSVLLSALTVAREWERGSMEQLFATPVGRFSVVVGKVLPYVGLGVMQFMLVVTAGAWIFEVPVAGSMVPLFVAVLLFLVSAIGQGLLISMVSKNQQIATQVGAITAILPSLLLSGFIFPIENMPAPLQLVARIIPARYLVTCLRGVLLEGVGFVGLWRELLSLLLLAAVMITLTTLKFERRIA